MAPAAPFFHRSSARPSHRRLFILLFLALNCFYLLTSSGRVRTIDEVIVDFQAESLATHASTSIPQAITANLFYGKLDRAGRPQAPYGLGQALVVVPWYEAARLLRAKLPGIPPRAADIALDAVLTASSATFSALAASLAFLIFLRLGIATRSALGAALLLALATPLFAYSAWFFSEPLVAAVLLAAALFLFTGPAQEASAETRAQIPVPAAVAAGACLGFALWIRPTHVLAAAVFLLAILVRERGKALRPLLIVGTVVGLFGVAYLVRNQILFGNILDFGYPATAEGGKQILTFETPFFRGLFGFLLSPGKSIFIFAPPILLALAGLPRLARRDPGLAVVAVGAPLAYLLFFARYTQWEGGYSVGPRYIVPALVLLCLALGPILADAGAWMRRVAIALFVLGFLVQIVGMATSFIEDQANGTYYDQHYNYRMSYNPLVSQTRLLLHYAATPGPAPLGRGFDRWFVFLAKIGVARGTILIFFILEWLGAMFFSWQLEGLAARPRDG